MPRLDSILRKYIEEKYGERLSRSYIINLLEQGAVRFKGEVIKRKGLKFPVNYIEKFEYSNELIKKAIDEYQKGLDLTEQSILWDKSSSIGDIKLDKALVSKAFDLKPYIVYEDNNFILTYKPAGVLSHPDKFGNPNNMVFAFIKYMSSVHKSLPRAGLLHRLDKQTQGLLLFAKNMKAYNHVKHQFMEHQLHKLYLVAFKISNNISGKAKYIKKLLRTDKLQKFMQLWHAIAKKNLLINSKGLFDYVFSLEHIDLFGFIAQHRSRKFSRFEETKDRLKTKHFLRIKEAKSVVYPLGCVPSSLLKGEGFGEIYNLFKDNENMRTLGGGDTSRGMCDIGIAAIRLITGRTHQIRAQFRYLGIPVLNDLLYGNKESILGLNKVQRGATNRPLLRGVLKHDAKNEVLSRAQMFLLAFGLSFYNLDGKREYFAVPGEFLSLSHS